MGLTSTSPVQFLPQETQALVEYRRKKKRKVLFSEWRQPDILAHQFLEASESEIVEEAGYYVLRFPTVQLQTSDAELRQTFDDLVRAWRGETRHISSTLHRVTHPAYQKIIGMGPCALPWILEELKARPDFWFWALRSISREDPSQPTDDLQGVRDSWLQWGVERRLISSDR